MLLKMRPLKMVLQAASYMQLSILSLLLLTGGVCHPDFALAEPDLFVQSLTEKVAEAERQKITVVTGKEGWLFFAPELRHLSVGQFWGDAAKKVSQASNPEFADPLPAILDFKAQLDTAGINLIFVPIPAKASIYPEMISEHGTAKPRTDQHHIKFYDVLREKGVNVLDLTDLFIQNRFTEVVHCIANRIRIGQDRHVFWQQKQLQKPSAHCLGWHKFPNARQRLKHGLLK